MFNNSTFCDLYNKHHLELKNYYKKFQSMLLQAEEIIQDAFLKILQANTSDQLGISKSTVEKQISKTLTYLKDLIELEAYVDEQ